MNVRSARRGFTLVELLVVISIIGVLVALLLPAVQAAREAARRAQCSNNVKQLVLAMHSYHQSQSLLPLNYKGGGYAATDMGTSWMVGILPHLEQVALYQQVRFDQAVGFADNVKAFSTVLSTYRCPSDAASFGDGRLEGPYTASCCDDNRWWTYSKTAYTNYKACAGGNWCWGDFNVKQDHGRWAGECDGFSHGNGIICRNWGPVTTTRLEDVTDGTSNTFAVGEAVAHWCGWSQWGWSNGSTATCGVPLNYRKGMVDLHAVWDDWSRNYSFFSMHSDGAFFGMSDGSVRFVVDSIDISVYRGLASISSGETVQAP